MPKARTFGASREIWSTRPEVAFHFELSWRFAETPYKCLRDGCDRRQEDEHARDGRCWHRHSIEPAPRSRSRDGICRSVRRRKKSRRVFDGVSVAEFVARSFCRGRAFEGIFHHVLEKNRGGR